MVQSRGLEDNGESFFERDIEAEELFGRDFLYDRDSTIDDLD